MKKSLLFVGLVTGLSSGLRAGETLRLKVEPERDCLLLGAPQELVVRIDLSATRKTLQAESWTVGNSRGAS